MKLSYSLLNYINSDGICKGTNGNICLVLKSLTDVHLEEILQWMNTFNKNEKTIDRINIKSNGKTYIRCFPLDWDWEHRTAKLTCDYYE